jgi:hypothetical protein
MRLAAADIGSFDPADNRRAETRPIATGGTAGGPAGSRRVH